MPTLQFKGKNIIWNHHLSIPFHTLDEMPKLDFQADRGEGNLIIEGDNLLALKALLPLYAGKVKCIYIDPPYNTGNEGWVYNDKVNSPLIKDWLGKEVGKDDLTRHDKWQCMMTPRLKLLRELLADEGAIFICIDDNEHHNLKCLMDEIFGEEHFVANICWKHTQQCKNDEKYFSRQHNMLLVYRKTDKLADFRMERTDEHNKNYSNPDNDPKGEWRSGDVRSPNYRKTLCYEIKTPSGKKISPPENGWRWSAYEVQNKIATGEIIFSEDETKIIRKIYLCEQEGRIPETVWSGEEYGTTRRANSELKELFNGEKSFDTPKPVNLIRFIINLFSGNDFLILDSFAGSGTTMHAVLDLNREDGGNRKCILVQMSEATEADSKKNICKDITRERVKRAIEKYGYNSGFKYLKVGIPIDPESMLSGNLPNFKQFAKYVYYLCTGEHPQDESQIDEKSYFIGTFKKEAVYLVYKQDYDELTRLALNLPLAERIIKDQKGKKCIVYAPACFLEEDYLKEKSIEYVGIPYNLFRRNAS